MTDLGHHVLISNIRSTERRFPRGTCALVIGALCTMLWALIGIALYVCGVL